MIFKDTVVLLTHISSRMLSHFIVPDNTLKVYNSTCQQGNSNRTLKICLVTLFVVRNDNNAIAACKTVNGTNEVIFGIEGDANKVKTKPQKIK